MIEDNAFLTIKQAAARCKIKDDLMRSIIARKEVAEAGRRVAAIRRSSVQVP